jgi:phage FluMu protein Com
MKCPYCQKNNCVTEKVLLNTEIYGNTLFDVPCIHCNKMISVFTERVAQIIDIQKSNKTIEESDF